MHVTLDTSGTIPRLRFRNRETYMSTKTAEYDDQVECDCPCEQVCALRWQGRHVDYVCCNAHQQVSHAAPHLDLLAAGKYHRPCSR